MKDFLRYSRFQHLLRMSGYVTEILMFSYILLFIHKTKGISRVFPLNGLLEMCECNCVLGVVNREL